VDHHILFLVSVGQLVPFVHYFAHKDLASPCTPRTFSGSARQLPTQVTLFRGSFLSDTMIGARLLGALAWNCVMAWPPGTGWNHWIESRLGLALHRRAETLSESKYSAFLGIQKADSTGSGGHTHDILAPNSCRLHVLGALHKCLWSPKAVRHIRRCFKSHVDEK
jgi:hypothetical protein